MNEPERDADGWTQAMRDEARIAIERLLAGQCPLCGAVVTSERQIGRCVYAAPCGHRIYQGRAGAWKNAPQSRT